eukprot:7727258-Heterocapsa_arctica.AAC.1
MASNRILLGAGAASSLSQLASIRRRLRTALPCWWSCSSAMSAVVRGGASGPAARMAMICAWKLRMWSVGAGNCPTNNG